MDTLYLKLEQKKQVSSEKALLGDIATLVCADNTVTNRLQAIPLAFFSGTKKQRAIFTVTHIIEKIQEIYPSIEITLIGETDVIIEYIPPKKPSKCWEITKVTIVCLISFFGAAFTIITFNNDVSAGEVFEHLYTSFTGKVREGATILEITYSLGLSLGIIGFFNHISGHRLTTDPTPIEVEMEQYEYNVNKSLISYDSRKGDQNDSKTNSSGNHRS